MPRSAGSRASGKMVVPPLLGTELRPGHLLGGAHWGCREGLGGMLLVFCIFFVSWDEMRPPWPRSLCVCSVLGRQVWA